MPEFIYDAVRYSNFPYAQTHPARLATVAILHGVEPPDPLSCRVLEIGCGAGGNLLAMAAATPGIHAVGIDLAAGPIAEASAAVAEIGLTNVSFQVADVASVADGSLGEFDYIVAHGVYAWIPEDAREALMATVGASLAEDGIAYVSYNAQPGGYFRRMLRDVGLWWGKDAGSELERAAQAQELYRWLFEQRATNVETYGGVLARELPPLAEGPLYRLVHDDLSEFWSPVWFADFAAHAAAHGLAYVGEADLYSLRVELMPDSVEESLRGLADGDRVVYENLSDMLVARHFRQSVLCRSGRSVDPEPAPERVERLHWSVKVASAPAADVDARSPHAELLAAIYAQLDGVRPFTLQFDELLHVLEVPRDALREALLDGFRHDHLIPHAGPLTAVSDPGAYPKASPLARWQASQGPELTTLAYTTVRMEEPAARLLITLLDGTRDRATILSELESATGLRLSESDLDRNLTELSRLFLLAR